METFKYKNKLWRFIYIKFMRAIKQDKKQRYPKNIPDAQKTVADIWMILLRDPETKLYYDITTQECSLESKSKHLEIFLESENIKIVNSTFGFDKRISSELEYYLADRFRQENSKRRILMKQHAQSKIEHSLSNTLIKLKS